MTNKYDDLRDQHRCQLKAAEIFLDIPFTPMLAPPGRNKEHRYFTNGKSVATTYIANGIDDEQIAAMHLLLSESPLRAYTAFAHENGNISTSYQSNIVRLKGSDIDTSGATDMVPKDGQDQVQPSADHKRFDALVRQCRTSPTS